MAVDEGNSGTILVSEAVTQLQTSLVQVTGKSALLWLSATGTREIGQSRWQLADTGVMTCCDDTSATILGPQTGKEPRLGSPASGESCWQKVTAQNHVRTGIEPEYSTFSRRKTRYSTDRCESPAEI